MRIAEPTLPAMKRLNNVAANGKRCSSAKISAASVERNSLVMALIPSLDRLPFRSDLRLLPRVPSRCVLAHMSEQVRNAALHQATEAVQRRCGSARRKKAPIRFGPLDMADKVRA